MLPFLQLLSEGQEWKMRDIVESLALRFSLTDEERQEMLPSGQSKVFNNRVGWVKTHLKNAGLVDNPTRGKGRLSVRGSQVLAKNPEWDDPPWLYSTVLQNITNCRLETEPRVARLSAACATLLSQHAMFNDSHASERRATMVTR